MRVNHKIISQKKSRFLVILPTLNETKKFHKIIDRINHLEIQCDILVVDGGSTDDTLDKIDAISNLVALILVKEGLGLSTQVYFGMRFAISHGYDGVVTMDTNGKDDPSFIKSFTDKLESGIDYVQGSRYMEGGDHVNTPFWRHFAVRYIHAPLISLRSGFNFSDTTQGYRGWSINAIEKLLKDKDEYSFIRYQLLFFMTYEAAKRGFACCEIPVKRVYPEGKIPTKMNGLTPKLLLLKDLINVVYERI